MGLLEKFTDEEYFEALQETFNTIGWKLFLEELEANATNINSVEDTMNLEDLLTRKGQLKVISNIINLEDTIELAMSGDEEEAEEDE